MTTGRHISEVSSARFEAAVSASLARFKRGGLPFSLSDVIRDARYEDGAGVGETTIYARGPDGKRVHADLLAEIKSACARSRARMFKKGASRPGGETDGELPSAGLRRQLVEQESRIQELESALATVSLQMRRAQEEQYVALATLNQLTKGTVLDVVRPLRVLLEAMAGRSDLVVKLAAEADGLADQCGRLVRSLTC